MNEDIVLDAVLSAYKKCKIKKFPIDCMKIIKKYGLEAVPYSMLSDRKRDKIMDYSKEAIICGNKIFYNDEVKSEQRIRFTLMHELGHHVLGHDKSTPMHEDEADAFAAYMLAPRIDIHMSKVKDVEEASRKYQISIAAANRAFGSCHFFRCFGVRMMSATAQERAIGAYLGYGC